MMIWSTATAIAALAKRFCTCTVEPLIACGRPNCHHFFFLLFLLVLCSFRKNHLFHLVYAEVDLCVSFFCCYSDRSCLHKHYLSLVSKQRTLQFHKCAANFEQIDSIVAHNEFQYRWRSTAKFSDANWLLLVFLLCFVFCFQSTWIHFCFVLIATST